MAQGVRMHLLMKPLLGLCFLGLAACNNGAPPPSPSSSGSPPSSAVAKQPVAGLTRVADPSQVCMVNDQFMGKAQIPVQVEGRTYYGCCAMCKEKLENQPAIRTATDPVTGEQVDKARAIIAQDPSGKVLYFASEQTLARYRG